ncbi:MAG: DUF1214 domain-containing protein [Pseudomonadota bacterium]
MSRLFLLLAMVVLGAFVGAASALWSTGIFGGRGIVLSDIDVAGWVSDWSIGSPSSGPYTRARIARHGLLALTKEEAVYFTRSTDDSGEPLSDTCDYLIAGEAQPAEWWSVTLYDAGSRLPMNDDGALSLDATRIGEEGAWEAVISASKPQDGNLWISSLNAGNFDLTLRLYRPLPALLTDPQASLAVPSIERIDCEGRVSG